MLAPRILESPAYAHSASATASRPDAPSPPANAPNRETSSHDTTQRYAAGRLTPCLKARCRAQSAPPPVPIWRTDENRLPLCPLRIITPQPCQHGARQRHLPTAARLALPRANPHLPLLPIHIAPGQTPHLIRTNPAVEHHRHARRTGGKLLPLCRPQ